MTSLLTAVHRAARYDTAAAPHEDRTHPRAEPPPQALSHAERVRVVANDPRLAGQPGLRDLAVQTAERAPASVLAGEIVDATIASFAGRNIDVAALASANKQKWAPQAEGAADPFSIADQAGRPSSDHGWSKAVASIPAAGGAIASGGPFDPHPSSFME